MFSHNCLLTVLELTEDSDYTPILFSIYSPNGYTTLTPKLWIM